MSPAEGKLPVNILPVDLVSVPSTKAKCSDVMKMYVHTYWCSCVWIRGLTLEPHTHFSYVVAIRLLRIHRDVACYLFVVRTKSVRFQNVPGAAPRELQYHVFIAPRVLGLELKHSRVTVQKLSTLSGRQARAWLRLHIASG